MEQEKSQESKVSQVTGLSLTQAWHHLTNEKGEHFPTLAFLGVAVVCTEDGLNELVAMRQGVETFSQAVALLAELALVVQGSSRSKDGQAITPVRFVEALANVIVQTYASRQPLIVTPEQAGIAPNNVVQMKRGA